MITSCLRPLGRLTARHAEGGMGRDDGRSERYPVMGQIRVDAHTYEIHYPTRKGADVRRVLRCEKTGRTDFRRESK